MNETRIPFDADGGITCPCGRCFSFKVRFTTRWECAGCGRAFINDHIPEPYHHGLLAVSVTRVQRALEAALLPPDNDSWVALVNYAYAIEGDGARHIQRITAEYNRVRDELKAALLDVDRLDTLDREGVVDFVRIIPAQPGGDIRKRIDKFAARAAIKKEQEG